MRTMTTQPGSSPQRSNPSFANALQLLVLLSKQTASTVVTPQSGARCSKCWTKRLPTPPEATW